MTIYLLNTRFMDPTSINLRCQEFMDPSCINFTCAPDRAIFDWSGCWSNRSFADSLNAGIKAPPSCRAKPLLFADDSLACYFVTTL